MKMSFHFRTYTATDCGFMSAGKLLTGVDSTGLEYFCVIFRTDLRH